MPVSGSSPGARSSRGRLPSSASLASLQRSWASLWRSAERRGACGTPIPTWWWTCWPTRRRSPRGPSRTSSARRTRGSAHPSWKATTSCRPTWCWPERSSGCRKSQLENERVVSRPDHQELVDRAAACLVCLVLAAPHGVRSRPQVVPVHRALDHDLHPGGCAGDRYCRPPIDSLAGHIKGLTRVRGNALIPGDIARARGGHVGDPHIHRTRVGILHQGVGLVPAGGLPVREIEARMRRSHADRVVARLTQRGSSSPVHSAL